MRNKIEDGELCYVYEGGVEFIQDPSRLRKTLDTKAGASLTEIGSITPPESELPGPVSGTIYQGS